MPMMDKLIADLNNNPPQTPEELEDMLAATGYSLAVSEGEMGMEPDGMYSEEGEYEEDMGPEGAMDVTVIAEEAAPMPPAEMLIAGVNPHKAMADKRNRVAKRAMEG